MYLWVMYGESRPSISTWKWDIYQSCADFATMLVLTIGQVCIFCHTQVNYQELAHLVICVSSPLHFLPHSPSGHAKEILWTWCYKNFSFTRNPVFEKYLGEEEKLGLSVSKSLSLKFKFCQQQIEMRVNLFQFFKCPGNNHTWCWEALKACLCHTLWQAKERESPHGNQIPDAKCVLARFSPNVTLCKNICPVS